MDETQIAAVLAKAAAFDQRTVGETDILAWMEAVGDLDFADALDAVTRHYQNSTDFLRPAHLRQQALEIRNQRATQRHSEALEVPSRFEPDDLRDKRIRDGVAQLAQVLSVPAADSDSPRDRAIARARSERRADGREAPPAPIRRSGKPVDISKIPGPEWADEAAREQQSVAALHAAQRPCGRAACTRATCHHEEG